MNNRLGRRAFLKAIGFGAGACISVGRLSRLAAAAPAAASKSRPHIILAMGDDQG